MDTSVDISNLLQDVETIKKDLQTAESNHLKYITSRNEMTSWQGKVKGSAKHINYLSTQIKKDIKKAEHSKNLLPGQKEQLQQALKELSEAQEKVTLIQYDLPADSLGLYLSVILGGNLDITLTNPDSRYRYKQDYEKFKMSVTIVTVVMLFLCYFFPFRAIDALCNFLLVWYYCTLTIRESILRVNRSKIKGWWVMHHYISTVLAGITLTWSDGVCYKQSRNLLITLTGYVSLLQILQYRYQTGVLRRLHALGQRDDMDVTVEGFSSWMFKGLSFLIPFLVVGYIFQGYCAYSLYYMYFYDDPCGAEWQVLALAGLFSVVASGNLVTMLIVLARKFTNRFDIIYSQAARYRTKTE